MRTFALAALAVALAAPAVAQETTLRPGHPDLSTAGLSLDDQTVSTRVTTPSARDLGTRTYAYTRDGDVVTLVSTSETAQGAQSVTATFRWPSLAPVSHEQTAGQTRGTTTYDGTRVTGTFGRGEFDPLPFELTLPAPAFQPEVVPLVARSLPLRAGYTATLPTFNAQNRLRDVTLTVVGEEAFTRADGTVLSAWVVEETMAGMMGMQTRRHYVDGATRELVATTGTGPNNARLVTEPVTEESLEALGAQTPATALRPGLDRLATDALRSYEQDYVVKLVEPQQQDIGTMTRSLVVDRAAGTVTLEATTSIPMAGQRTVERSVVAYPSLTPISSRVESGGTVYDLTYGDGAVTGTKTEGGASEDVEVAFEDAVFDASMAAELVRLVPFEEGFRGEYFTVSPAEGATSVFFDVTGQDEVDGRPVWLVAVDAGPAAPAQTLAVDAETRETLRIRLEPQVGVVIDIVPVEGE